MEFDSDVGPTCLYVYYLSSKIRYDINVLYMSLNRLSLKDRMLQKNDWNFLKLVIKLSYTQKQIYSFSSSLDTYWPE